MLSLLSQQDDGERKGQGWFLWCLLQPCCIPCCTFLRTRYFWKSLQSAVTTTNSQWIGGLGQQEGLLLHTQSSPALSRNCVLATCAEKVGKILYYRQEVEGFIAWLLLPRWDSCCAPQSHYHHLQLATIMHWPFIATVPWKNALFPA